MNDSLINSRVRLEYSDQNESFSAYLPVVGTIRERLVAITGPDDWYLVDLDESLDYQHQAGANYQFQRHIISRVLIRSRTAGEPISRESSISVFLLLVTEDKTFESETIDIDNFIFICWAMCHVLDAA